MPFHLEFQTYCTDPMMKLQSQYSRPSAPISPGLLLWFVPEHAKCTLVSMISQSLWQLLSFFAAYALALAPKHKYRLLVMIPIASKASLDVQESKRQTDKSVTRMLTMSSGANCLGSSCNSERCHSSSYRLIKKR
jgi:hypothetical protein